MSLINNSLTAVVESRIFSVLDCENIIKYAKGIEETEGEVTSSRKINKKLRKSKTRWIRKGHGADQMFEKIYDRVKTLNETFWKLKIDEIEEAIQFTVYEGPEAHHNWHIDTATELASRRKLSVCIQLSDPNDYEGGGLEIQATNLVDVGKMRGHAVFFPSMLAHRVKPVTAGVRYSLVVWISGPPFS